jgi:hypothetical protein
MKKREQVVRGYIEAYNNFDIDKMVENFDASIKFENVSKGVIDMTIVGLAEFRKQAEQAKKLFSKRRQTIKSFHHYDDQAEIEIGYNAILAIDLPNGLKKGEEINLVGKSIFKFSNDRIVELTDMS